MLQPHEKTLQAVQYSSRYVLGLFYENLTKLDGIEWSAKYIYDNPCIRYIAMDTIKRKTGMGKTRILLKHVCLFTTIFFSVGLVARVFKQVNKTPPIQPQRH